MGTGHEGRYGFTQLGYSPPGNLRREAGKRLRLSVVLINGDSRLFAVENLSRVRNLLAPLGPGGEIILVDRDASPERNEQLLRQFPEVRILIPTVPLRFRPAMFLGIREAGAPHVLVLDAAWRLEEADAEALLALCAEPDLFALGPRLLDGRGRTLPSVIGVVADPGRIRLTETDSPQAETSFFLKDFQGIYNREKVLLLGEPEGGPDGPWAAADFFFAAWGRGWLTLVDPAFRVTAEPPPTGMALPAGFRARYRRVRGEIGFLRRNFVDRESRRIRRRLFLVESFRELLRLKPALAAACLVEAVRRYLLLRPVRARREAVYTAAEIFSRIRHCG